MQTAFPNRERRSVSGVGIGLRNPHVDQLMTGKRPVPWLELLADNFLAAGGLTPKLLERIAERYPVTLHCVGMNLGGLQPLNETYLGRICTIARRTGAAWVSDHLCFTSVGDREYHDLLPLPYSDEAVRHVAARIMQVQDRLGDRLVLENVSAYLRADTPMTEAAFLLAVCEESDCDLLLDVNNLYVNQVNLGLDAGEVLEMIPARRIREIHLAGYEDKGDHLIDAHNNRVSEPVWALFAQLRAKAPDAAVCIEWDNAIPELEVLLAEAAKARALSDVVLGRAA